MPGKPYSRNEKIAAGLAVAAGLWLVFRNGGGKRPPIAVDEQGRPMVRTCKVSRIENNHAYPSAHEASSEAIAAFIEEVRTWDGGPIPLLELTEGAWPELHTHTVVLDPGLVERLQRGETITTATTMDNGHRHTITLGCTGPRG